jgi:hypothetical protein
MFELLGVATFATVASVGLLVFRARQAWDVAHVLSPLLSVGTAPALAVGLLIGSRVQKRGLVRLRVAGTAIAIGAAMVLVGAIALAWPDPAYLLPLAVADFVILSVIAVTFGIPAAHWIALPCALIGYSVAIAVLRGRLGWISSPRSTIGALLDPACGTALVGLFELALVGAWVFRRLGRARDARVISRAALVVGVVSLGLLSRTAFDRTHAIPTATFVYGFYAAAALAAAVALGSPGAGWAGCGLLLAACVQGTLARTNVTHPWAVGLLIGATVEAVGSLVILRIARLRAALSLPLKWTATLAVAAALTLLVPGASMDGARVVGAEILWAAGLWFAIALAESSEAIFIAAELALGVGLAVSVVGALARHAWFRGAKIPLLHPWTLEAIGVALAGIPLAAAVARRALPEKWTVRRWLDAPWSVDRGLAIVLATGLTILACVGAFDAIRIEFAVRAVERSPAVWAGTVAGYGSWVLLAVLAGTFAAWTIRRTAPRAGLLLLWVVILGCPLVAMRWAEAGSAASVLRWLLAAAGLAGSALLWGRDRVARPLGPRLRDQDVADFRAILVAMCAVPVIVLSVYPAGLSLDGRKILGPAEGTFFAAIGNSASYSIPLLLVAASFLGHAVRERSGAWVCASTAVTNLTVTLAYALAVTTGGRLWDDSNSLRLVQLNVIALGFFALGWIGLRGWLYRRSDTEVPRPPGVLVGQVAIAVAGISVPLFGEAMWLWIWPGYADNMAVLSDPVAWMAVVVTLATVVLLYGALSPCVIGTGAAVAAMMTAFTAAHYDPTHWLSFHVLMCGVLGAAGAVFAGAVIREARGVGDVAPVADKAPAELVEGSAPAVALEYHHKDRAAEPEVVDHPVRANYVKWIVGFSVWLVLLGMRSTISDPQRPWWATSCTLMLGFLWVAVACWMRSGSLLYVGGLLPNLAATFWWLEKPWTGSHDLADLLCGNATVLAAGGLAGIVLHRQVFRFRRADRSQALPYFHRFALNVVTLGLVLFGGAAVLNALAFNVGAAAPLTAVPALLAGAALAVATLADDGTFALGQLYMIGLAGVAIVIQLLHPSPGRAEWAYQIGICAFVALTGMFFYTRTTAARVLSEMGLTPVVRSAGTDLVRLATAVLAAMAVCLAIRVDFTVPELSLRLAAATAALLQLGALGVMAAEARLLQLRQLRVLLAVAAVVAWVWAWMTPGAADPLARSAAALVGITAAVCFGGALSVALKRAGRWLVWAEAMGSVVPVVWAMWIAAVGAVLAFEIGPAMHREAVRLSAGWVLVVLAVMIAGVAACVRLSSRAGERDSIGIRPPMRGIYVYAAELLLAAAFCHLRLTMPWLFSGFFAQYWPLIVMAIAFAGVGLGEVMERRKLPVVSGPLTTTGVFLPILPAVAFSLMPSRVDYATLLFLIGFFYAVLSAARRSFVLGVAAALAANGGLWSLLYRHPELRLMIHPQLWLIPAAVSVLIAAQLNRDRLPAPQLRFIRYACLMLVYVSSTADVFLNGVRDHPYLPLVLALLSVIGVMTGILFRIRPFLFLGASFLAVAIVTMIYFASVNLHWTWLWYVAGIALGAGIIALFALFEKKRTEMLALVEGLRSWQ